jgi:hypothetical protein
LWQLLDDGASGRRDRTFRDGSQSQLQLAENGSRRLAIAAAQIGHVDQHRSTRQPDLDRCAARDFGARRGHLMRHGANRLFGRLAPNRTQRQVRTFQPAAGGGHVEAVERRHLHGRHRRRDPDVDRCRAVGAGIRTGLLMDDGPGRLLGLAPEYAARAAPRLVHQDRRLLRVAPDQRRNRRARNRCCHHDVHGRAARRGFSGPRTLAYYGSEACVRWLVGHRSEDEFLLVQETPDARGIRPRQIWDRTQRDGY